jgi:type III secretory pathway component EscV
MTSKKNNYFFVLLVSVILLLFTVKFIKGFFMILFIFAACVAVIYAIMNIFFTTKDKDYPKD